MQPPSPSETDGRNTESKLREEASEPKRQGEFEGFSPWGTPKMIGLVL